MLFNPSSKRQAVLASGVTVMTLILNFTGSVGWDINLCLFVEKDKGTEPRLAQPESNLFT